MKWLADDWKNIHKRWSTRFQIAAAGLASYLTAVPDATIQFWNILPDDLKSAIPATSLKWASVALIVIGVLSAFIKQSKLHEDAGVGPESKS